MTDFVVERALQIEQAEKFRKDLDSISDMHDGTVGHGGKGPIVDTVIRQSPVAFPDKHDALVRDRFADLEKMILCLNETKFKLDVDPKSFEWQFTRYAAGGDFYRQHVDCAFKETEQRMRKLSGSLLLTDPRDVRGGTFRFTMGIDSVAPLMQGEMVVFCSFLPHSVSPILRGVRESLVFWLWGPNFR